MLCSSSVLYIALSRAALWNPRKERKGAFISTLGAQESGMQHHILLTGRTEGATSPRAQQCTAYARAVRTGTPRGEDST